jgi:putative transposase
MKLNQKRRTKKRVPKRDPASMVVIDRINAVWALDFMYDALYGGRMFRTLNVIDEADRGGLGIDVAVSIPVRIPAMPGRHSD